MRRPPAGSRRGNCYVAAEALFHILGGYRDSPWRPHRLRLPSGETHWFLKDARGYVLDPSRRQFPKGGQPDYTTAVGAGFLTRRPSKRARALMKTLTWQEG